MKYRYYVLLLYLKGWRGGVVSWRNSVSLRAHVNCVAPSMTVLNIPLFIHTVLNCSSDCGVPLTETLLDILFKWAENGSLQKRKPESSKLGKRYRFTNFKSFPVMYSVYIFANTYLFCTTSNAGLQDTREREMCWLWWLRLVSLKPAVFAHRVRIWDSLILSPGSIRRDSSFLWVNMKIYRHGV